MVMVIVMAMMIEMVMVMVMVMLMLMVMVMMMMMIVGCSAFLGTGVWLPPCPPHPPSSMLEHRCLWVQWGLRDEIGWAPLVIQRLNIEEGGGGEFDLVEVHQPTYSGRRET